MIVEHSSQSFTFYLVFSNIFCWRSISLGGRRRMPPVSNRYRFLCSSHGETRTLRAQRKEIGGSCCALNGRASTKPEFSTRKPLRNHIGTPTNGSLVMIASGANQQHDYR